MKTIYQCEICGLKSIDKEKVQKCEAQGRKNKFSLRQEIRFRLGEKKGSSMAKATVVKVRFEKATHEPLYNLVSQDERLIRVNRKGLLAGCFPEKRIFPL